MKIRSTFLKNLAYDRQPERDEEGNYIKHEIPRFKGTVDIGGIIYDGLLYVAVGEYGKEVMILCLDSEEEEPPF